MRIYVIVITIILFSKIYASHPTCIDCIDKDINTAYNISSEFLIKKYWWRNFACKFDLKSILVSYLFI